jgi:hypothetical protein
MLARRQIPLRTFALAFAAAFAVVTAPALAAEEKVKSTQSEGKWVKYDSAAQTATVKITKEGKGAKPPAGLELKKGREELFKVNPSGSVLTRTSVKINGMKGEITQIPEGKNVLIYWVKDEKDPKSRFARLIDVTLSDEELDAKYGVDKAEE